MIFNLTLCIAITSLFVNGLDIATGEGMILHFVRRWLDKVFIKWRVSHTQAIIHPLYYPVLYCIRCMPSIYGTGICLLLLPFTAALLWQVPVVVVCSVGLATIIHSQYL